MQALYAYKCANIQTLPVLKSNLEKNIGQPLEILCYLLLLIREIANYSEEDMAIRSSKFLPTEEDRLPSTCILKHPVISWLNQNEDFEKLLKQYKLQPRIDHDQVRALFNDFNKSTLFREYKANQEPSADQQKKILDFLVKEIMLSSEDLDSYLLEEFNGWIDDSEGIGFSLLAVLNDIMNGQGLSRVRIFWEKNREMNEFAGELLEKSLDHFDEYTQLLAPKIRNWELDRIAKIDLVLMVMALTEILDFPTIPVKVTINEYIDISKLYSTPKSREFINGVLDKMMKELKANGRIVKTGRGLLNN